MPWVQYTRNFEDVILRRVFKDIDSGCFIDVGACHPITDSNTYALYERGWRGIAVEPIEEAANSWAATRPGDIFVSAAVGSYAGTKEFFVVSQAIQASTTDLAHADLLQRHGAHLIKRSVPLMTLDAILDRHLAGRTLHLLSMDVEGAELEALKGLELSRYRPWVMVIEAVLPGTSTPAHQEWEAHVVDASYDFVYFDGANRFYVAREHADLKRHFGLPPNVWDDFVSHTTVELQRELAALRDASLRRNGERR